MHLKCNFINRLILPLIDFYPIGPRMGCNDIQMGRWAPSSRSLWSQFVRREAGTSDDKLLPDRKYRENEMLLFSSYPAHNQTPYPF